MKLILVSPSSLLEGELDLLNELFREGLTCFHLRKYEFTETEVIEYLKKLPGEARSKVMLHHHHYLMKTFPIKGLHFNRFHKDIQNIPKDGLCFSRSAHSLEALDTIEPVIDHVLLSPLFDSLSKPGHSGSLDHAAVKAHLGGHHYPFAIYGMSGVTVEDLDRVRGMGFDGVAVSGTIWNTFHEEGMNRAIENFKALQETVAL